jgi:hypothetical protein
LHPGYGPAIAEVRSLGPKRFPKSEIYTADAMKANIYAESVMCRDFRPINSQPQPRLQTKPGILRRRKYIKNRKIYQHCGRLNSFLQFTFAGLNRRKNFSYGCGH